MSQHSSASPSSHIDIEEKGEDELMITSTLSPSPEHHAYGDLEEKQHDPDQGSLGVEQIHPNRRHLNNPAVPGVPLDDDSDLVGSHDAGERRTNGDDDDDAPRPSGGIVGVLDRVVSRVSTKSSWNPGPPPDGGVKAWTAGE